MYAKKSLKEILWNEKKRAIHKSEDSKQRNGTCTSSSFEVDVMQAVNGHLLPVTTTSRNVKSSGCRPIPSPGCDARSRGSRGVKLITEILWSRARCDQNRLKCCASVQLQSFIINYLPLYKETQKIMYTYVSITMRAYKNLCSDKFEFIYTHIQSNLCQFDAKFPAVFIKPLFI